MFGVSIRTYQRWITNPEGDLRKGPHTEPPNKLSSGERDKILAITCTPEFCDSSPKQIVPRLADRGEYIASEATFYRVLRSEQMLAHRGPQKPPRHERPKELIANAPNQVWSWDITYLKTSVLGRFYYLYLVMDIYSRKIVGWDLADRESEQISTKLVTNIHTQEGVEAGELFLHADNGGPMKASTMLGTLQKLGVIPSFSRPRVSDDNAYSESLFKTLKYRPFYPTRPFQTLAEAKQWVLGFVDWYNNEHMHSGINYVTPASRHNGDDERILDFRKQVFAEARMKNPERWTRSIRNFDVTQSVILNANSTNNELRAFA